MKFPKIVFLLFFYFPLTGQQTIQLPEGNKVHRDLLVGIRPAFNIGGAGKQIKNEMQKLGMSASNVGLLDENYPQMSSSASFFIEAEYKGKYLGYGLEYGLIDKGYSKGVKRTTTDYFGFIHRDYLRLNYDIRSFSPFLRAYLDRVGFQLGLSLNKWEVNDGDAKSYSLSKVSIGGNMGIMIDILDKDYMRVNLYTIYRYAGSKKIGPLPIIYEDEIQFPQRNVNFNYPQVGVSLDFNLFQSQNN